jgi:hypothetical protein
MRSRDDYLYKEVSDRNLIGCEALELLSWYAEA